MQRQGISSVGSSDIIKVCVHSALNWFLILDFCAVYGKKQGLKGHYHSAGSL